MQYSDRTCEKYETVIFLQIYDFSKNMKRFFNRILRFSYLFL